MLILSACVGPSDGAVPPVVRDSTGVRIVEHQGAPGRQALRLSSEPMTVIGVVSGEAHDQLNGVVGATRLEDGRIVIANGGTRELRFFTADGRHVRTVGGRGEGPGEFRWLRRLARLPGDTLIASDLAPGRWNWFNADGQFLTLTTQPIGGSDLPIILADASLVLPSWESASFGNEFELFAIGRRTPDADGVFRPRFALAHIDRTGATTDTIGVFTGEELYRIDIPGSIGLTWYMPFARRTLYTVSGDRVWIMHTGRPELEVYDLAGALRMRVRFPAPPVPVGADDRDGFRESVEPRMNPNRRADFERWFAEVPYPDTKAVATDLMAGADGTVWLKLSAPFDAAAEPWIVFLADGTRLGEVQLPVRTEPLEVGRDYLLALWRDALDVEFVHIYQIEGA